MGESIMKLHLGCGKRDFGPDWTHVDCGNFPHVTFHSIIDLPFVDDSCEVVYASHVLEYFDREEAVHVLREWCRVLKVGGIMRLAVPDFYKIATLYQLQLIPLHKILGPLYGKMQPPDCSTIYHKTVYDFHSLRSILESVGLTSIRRYDWRKIEHGHIDDHSQAYIPHMDKENGTLISLNVEGVKGEPQKERLP